jgi:streptomycin 6-kinase
VRSGVEYLAALTLEYSPDANLGIRKWNVSVNIPLKLRDACQNNPERLHWLDKLPEALSYLQERWSLTLGSPLEGDEVSCSWVAPVLREDQMPAILKLGMPHMEGADEIRGLRFWDGNPTVRLLDADDDLGAMLLEKCEPGTHLRELPESEQDPVIASLLRRLWRAPTAPHQFRPLATMTASWRIETLEQSEHWRDPDLVAEGLDLLKNLPEPSQTDVLLATDLHAGNVLRAQREPWLVIDPKPFVGDPAFDATQHLLNCYARLRSEPERTIRRIASLLDLDYERVRLWTFARAAAQAANDSIDDRWNELARAIAT